MSDPFYRVLELGGGVRSVLSLIKFDRLCAKRFRCATSMASCKSFTAIHRVVGCAGAPVCAMTGNSVRGAERVKTFPNVGAFATRALLSIFSSGICSQSRIVARIDA